MKQYKHGLIYLARFLGLFALLFYGTEAIIGLSSPGNHYNAFVDRYLNFIDPFRFFLLAATGKCLGFFGIATYFKNPYTLSFVGGRGVIMVYSCLGYGVISFWIAFVFANVGSWQRKAAWMIGGTVWLCGINIIRLALVLVATNKGWPFPLGWDHHTWFNIVAYGCIFAMIWLYDKQGKRPRQSAATKETDLQRGNGGTPFANHLSPFE